MRLARHQQPAAHAQPGGKPVHCCDDLARCLSLSGWITQCPPTGGQCAGRKAIVKTDACAAVHSWRVRASLVSSLDSALARIPQLVQVTCSFFVSGTARCALPVKATAGGHCIASRFDRLSPVSPLSLSIDRPCTVSTFCLGNAPAPRRPPALMPHCAPYCRSSEMTTHARNA